MSTEPGSDPIGDMQRWMMRAGARSIGREVAGRVRSTFGPGASKKDDVWDTATTEVLTDEPPGRSVVSSPAWETPWPD